MRIRAVAPGVRATWEVVAPPATTVGALAAAAGLPRASHFALGGRAVHATTRLGDAGVRDGALLTPLPADPPPPAAVALVAGAGPAAGTVWPLAPGRCTIGRHPAVDVHLDDPGVGALHVELCVGRDGTCTVRPRCDDPPAFLDGRRLTHAAPLDPGVALRLGTTVLRVEPCGRVSTPLLPDLALPAAPTGEDRSGPATLVRHRPPRRLPPPPPDPPVAPAPAPLPPAAATARGLVSMLVPSLTGAAVVAALRPSLLPLAAVAPVGAAASWGVLAGFDRRARRRARAATGVAAAAHTAAVAAHAAALDARLVARHPDPGEIACRIGRGDPRLWERRPGHDDFLVVAPGATAGTPLELDLGQPVGIVGPRAAALGAARALTVQVVAHHGPADCGIESWTTDAGEWSWLAWLPHAGGEGARTIALVDEGPLSPARRGAWRALLDAGGSAIVVARRGTELPEECTTVLEVDARGGATLHDSASGERRRVDLVWTFAPERVEELAAALAPWRDPDAATGAGALAEQMGLLALLGAAADDEPDGLGALVARRWAASRASGSLAAPLGAGADGDFVVDLVTDGPHALVAGTTGSGKSELLRALVVSLAASADVAHVAFVLVDYKGGSAFDGLAALPHVVDVVTDLDRATAQRAIAGLEGEIRRREHLLRRRGARDVADAQRRGREPVPRLVVVVDEFATLAQDLPAFVDALVDVAQRGRSLGVHLVLATQRPSGAVKDTIRTNTNLRIALRVLDRADSRDVLGDDAAAAIANTAAGRAFARRGPGPLVAFQCAHVGAARTKAVDELRLVPLGAAVTPRAGAPRELDVLVDAIVAAHRAGGLASPRRPWIDPLPPVLAWSDLRDAHGADVPRGLAFALADAPLEARHEVVAWQPARGNLLVTGMPGSGTTTALRTIVHAALASPHDAPDVYVVTTAPAEWRDLCDHDAVGAVVATGDDERVRRLLRRCAARIDERREGRAPDGPPILALIDGIGALRAEHDSIAGLDVLDLLERIASEGPAAGVHLALADGHAGGAGLRIDRTVAHRVLLRGTERHDAPLATDIDLASLRPGAGVDVPTGRLVQIARATDRPAPRRDRRAAPSLGVLPAEVHVDALPAARATAGGLHLPVGIGDADLAPAALTLSPHDHVLVCGPARSGRSNLLDALAHVAGRSSLDVVRIGTGRRSSPGTVHERDAIAAVVDSLLGRPGSRTTPALVLVDDADVVDDGGALERLVAAPRHVAHVVASVREDRVRGLFRHWTHEVRRGGIGVLLRADVADGDLLGVRLPRTSDRRTAGRGWLVRHGSCELVQFARAGGRDDAQTS